MTKVLSDAAARSGHRNFPPALSSDSVASSLTRVSSFSASRISVIPYLRRLDIGDDNSTHQKTPLLTLNLSSPSYLDSLVYDDASRHPVYTITTQGTSTVVSRTNSWEGTTRAADIKWPNLLPVRGKGRESNSVLVQMKGSSWKCGAAFLRAGTLASSPRKFKIPGYSKSLRWKQVGSSYWCITGSVKGPIAILDPAAGSVPPRIKVYETLHDKYDAHPMLVHRGISVLLLDYLLVTSLLLVTDIQEWMVVKKYEGDVSSISPLTRPPTATSPSQWRKIIFGEPLFPRRASSSAITLSRPQLSSGQMANVYGVRSPGADITVSFESDSEDDESDIEEVVQQPSTRPPSPSAESVCYPLMNTTAPAHTYLDPTFYAHDVPPVPPLPFKYASQNVVRVTTPSSASSTRQVRTLPEVPQSSTRPRSQSTPYRESPPPRPSHESFSSDSRTERPVRPVVRTSSISSRRLPVPPTPTTPGSSERQTLPSALHPSLREKRTSVHGRRSLPPTPISAPASTFSHSDRLPRRRKDAHDELFDWSGGRSSRNSVFDPPPPAYNSISFSGNPVMTNEIPVPPHSAV